MKKKKRKGPGGRPAVGQPISIVLTAAQRAWIDSRKGTRAAVVREIIQNAIEAERRFRETFG